MYKLILITIVILIGLISVTLWHNQNSQLQGPDLQREDQNNRPELVGELTPYTNTIPIDTPSGKVAVKNITRLPEVQDVGSDMYHLQGTVTDRDEAFSFLYSAVDNSFSVSIEDEPLSLQRQRASEYFLELFDVTESEACQLNVFVGVPYNVNATLAGANLGLSFCPGSMTL